VLTDPRRNPDIPSHSPPHNLEAEQALIGAILLDNRAFERVSEIISGPDFFDPLHEQIFNAACSLIQGGKLASATTLKSYFEHIIVNPQMNGAQYLGRLLAAATTVGRSADYAKTVRELADRRSLLCIGDDLATEAVQAGADVTAGSLIESAESRLFDLAERSASGRAGAVSFADASMRAVDRAKSAVRHGFAGVSTGIVDLDKKLGGLQRSDLIILAGRPSMGKTALATNIAYNVAKRGLVDEYGELRPAPVGFFSLEMSSDQLANRVISAVAGVSSSKTMRGLVTEDELQRLEKAAESLVALPLFIDDRGGITIAQLSARARRLKRTHGLELLVVDYVQLLSGTKKERVQEITQITTGLKALAKELNIPVIALSQLSRANEKREDKRPQLSDLRESGSIEQDADVVMFVFREEYYIEREKPDDGDFQKFREWQTKMLRAAGKAEAIIGKQRHGPVGIVELAFEAELTRFSDLARSNAS
jgi:replicative DNA helicase